MCGRGEPPGSPQGSAPTAPWAAGGGPAQMATHPLLPFPLGQTAKMPPPTFPLRPPAPCWRCCLSCFIVPQFPHRAPAAWNEDLLPAGWGCWGRTTGTPLAHGTQTPFVTPPLPQGPSPALGVREWDKIQQGAGALLGSQGAGLGAGWSRVRVLGLDLGRVLGWAWVWAGCKVQDWVRVWAGCGVQVLNSGRVQGAGAGAGFGQGAGFGAGFGQGAGLGSNSQDPAPCPAALLAQAQPW